MSLVMARLLRGSADDFSGYTRLSSLLTATSQGQDILPGPGSKVLFDVEMQDEDRRGYFDPAGTAEIRFDPRVNTRVLFKGIGLSGRLWAGSNATPHPTSATIDFWALTPTTNGFTPQERTDLGIGSGLVRGLSHHENNDQPTGNDGNKNDFGGRARGFLVEAGAELELYGNFAPLQRRLNAAYASGNVIQVHQPVTAPAGATVLVSPDGFFDVLKRTEIRTLAVAAFNTTTLTLNASLGFARFGQNQWYTDSGISLTQGAFTMGGRRTHADQDPEFDQRAFVVILAPSIKIRGYDVAGATSWADLGDGFHGMSMGLTSKTVLKNVGFEKYGQRGRLARYGWHFHLNSINVGVSGNGAFKTSGVKGLRDVIRLGGQVGDPGGSNFAPGQARLEGITGLQGQNIFLNLHACRGVELENCIGHDAAGHTYQEEDHSEEENRWKNCLALAPRDPGSGNRIKLHHAQAFGFWWSNPLNFREDNWGVDTPGGPFWNAHTTGLVGRASEQYGCLGLSAQVPIAPAYGMWGKNEGASGLCCGGHAESNNGTQTNAGAVLRFTGRRLVITTDGVAPANPYEYSPANEVAQGFKLHKVRLFKMPGYFNEVSSADYKFWRMADHTDWGLQGNANFGLGTAPIFVRETFNHESHYLDSYANGCFFTYHGLLPHVLVVADGYSGNVYRTDGGNHGALQGRAVVDSWSNYTDPVHDFPKDMYGWKLFNSRGMFQTPPWHIVQDFTLFDAIVGTGPGWDKNVTNTVTGEVRNWTLGVPFDKHGTLFQGPTTSPLPNGHIVWNLPYFTTGAASPTPLEGNPQSVSTQTPYMGVWVLRSSWDGGNGDNSRTQRAQVYERLDSSRNVISGATLSLGDSRSSSGQQIFWGAKHSSCPVGGRVRVRWPGVPKETAYFYAPTRMAIPADNPNLGANDWTIWELEWATGTAVAGVKCGNRTFTARASDAALQSGGIDSYWQDTTGGYICVKLGPSQSYAGDNLRIYASGQDPGN